MAATQLETFVNAIQNLYQQQSYQEINKQLNANLDVLVKNQQNLRNLLQIFPLPDYTIVHLGILYVLCGGGTSQQQQQNVNVDMLNELYTCLNNLDDRQIQHGADVLTNLCQIYTNRLCELNKPKYTAMLLIYNLIKKLQKTPNQLTSLHSDLLQLSLVSKNFSLALDVLSYDILDIHKENQAYDSKAFLSFFYYSGCIYGALKLFDKALFCFEQAITLLPCSAISQIMVESYKKFLLISLIHKGKLNLLPKYTSRVVINQIKPLCNAYHELHNSFINYDIDKLNATIAKYTDVYQQDSNTGLVRQLQQMLTKKSIQKLTKTYMTLSLADMAVKVRLRTAKEAETYLVNMIKDGEIFATINQKDGGMVCFYDNPEKYDTIQMMQYLNDKMFNLIDFDKKIKDMDRDITTHSDYIQKCLINMGSASGGASGLAGVDELLELANR